MAEAIDPRVGPIHETYKGGFFGRLRELGRFVLGPRYEVMDLSDLNDENDPAEGLVMSVGAPRNRRELYARIKEAQDEGIAGPLMIDRGYGFRPEGHSAPAPITTPGDSIVDAAKLLSDIRSGKRGFPRPTNPEALKLLAEIDEAMMAKRDSPDKNL